MTSALRSPVILHIDDEPDFLALFFPCLRTAGYEAVGAESVREAREILAGKFVDLILVDEFIGRDTGTTFLQEMRGAHPGLGAIVVSGHADLAMAVRAMEAGALSVISKPVTTIELLGKVRTALENSELAREARYQRWYAARESGFPEIVGQSDAVLKVLNTIRKAAPTQSTILVQGESGTGKELVARAIHAASRRRGQRFQADNLGALASGLVESTLFGHAKGSFTGAVADRIGLFEAANHGTLFLDEIGEAPPDVQVRLLRALEQKEITRVGESKPRSVDVRVIAATNRDLLQSVRARTFREDLYYRLQVVVIDVPPLRDRMDDLGPLCVHLLAEQNRQQGKQIAGFESAAMSKMRAYHWPGNVRELRNAVENAVIHAEGGLIAADDLVLRRDQAATELGGLLEKKYRVAIKEFNREYFPRLLEKTGNNQTAAAKLAGLNRSSFLEHLQKLEAAPDKDDE